MAELITRAVRDSDGFKTYREEELRLLKQRVEVLQ
jgi:hypothetical protein